MARTRSSTPREAVGSSDVSVESKTTFNGALEQFGFASTTSTATATKSLDDGTTASQVKRKRNIQATRQGSASPSKKQKRISSKYAPPSKYAHLKGIPDAITPNMLCLLVGHNPGVKTATAGHACELETDWT
jgi:thymine-DNA glycosylase